MVLHAGATSHGRRLRSASVRLQEAVWCFGPLLPLAAGGCMALQSVSRRPHCALDHCRHSQQEAAWHFRPFARGCMVLWAIATACGRRLCGTSGCLQEAAWCSEPLPPLVAGGYVALRAVCRRPHGSLSPCCRLWQNATWHFGLSPPVSAGCHTALWAVIANRQRPKHLAASCKRPETPHGILPRVATKAQDIMRPPAARSGNSPKRCMASSCKEQ